MSGLEIAEKAFKIRRAVEGREEDLLAILLRVSASNIGEEWPLFTYGTTCSIILKMERGHGVENLRRPHVYD
jgi:hypothetical protein